METKETHTLLTVPEVAQELKAKSVDVLRVIALRQLAAGRLGNAGLWRITRPQLEAFVEAGLPGFRVLRLDGEWFEDPDGWANDARRFHQAVEAAAAPQMPEEPLESWELDLNPEGITVELRMTPAINAVFVKSAPSDPNRNIFTGWDSLYVADQMRARAREIVGRLKGKLGESAVDRFFRTPEDFDATLAKAQAVFAERALLFPKSYRIIRAGSDATTVRVMFRLSHSNFTGSTVRNAVNAAF